MVTFERARFEDRGFSGRIEEWNFEMEDTEISI